MICPHCGKETGEMITFNAMVPNLNNGCNPTLVGNFVPFAANGCNPIIGLPNGNLFAPNACAAAAVGGNPQVITLHL